MNKLQTQTKQFERALKRLKEVLAMPKTDISRDSAIQRFEFTLDLGWKTMKTFLEEKKGVACSSPKDCFREAYKHGLILYEDSWLVLVDMRNETVHTYNEETAEKIYAHLSHSIKLFEELYKVISRD